MSGPEVFFFDSSKSDKRLPFFSFFSSERGKNIVPISPIKYLRATDKEETAAATTTNTKEEEDDAAAVSREDEDDGDGWEALGRKGRWREKAFNYSA